MSSLIINSSPMMMLEFLIEKIRVPKLSKIDRVLNNETIIMLKALENDWLCMKLIAENVIEMEDYIEEIFNSGKSIIFCVPESSLKCKAYNMNIEIEVEKEMSKYLEMETSWNVGQSFLCIETIFNGIVKELNELNEMRENFNENHQPISKSMKGSYHLMNENHLNGTINIYTRLSYLGKSIITETKTFEKDKFHCYPYVLSNFSVVSQLIVDKQDQNSSVSDLKIQQQQNIKVGSENFDQKQITNENKKFENGRNSRKSLNEEGENDVKGIKKKKVNDMKERSDTLETLKKVKDVKKKKGKKRK